MRKLVASQSLAKTWLPWLVLMPLFGCGRACEDHPYTPYTIGDGAPGQSTDAGAVAPISSAVIAKDAGARGMLPAPENAASWDVFGVTLVAPDDRVFAFAMRLGETNPTDVIAISRPKAAPGPVDLLDYRIDGAHAEPARILLQLKDEVLDASCAPVAQAEDKDAGGLFLSLSYTCAGHGAPPPRAVALVTQSKSGPRVRLAARIRDKENDPALDVRIDTNDVDHDGVPDVTLVADVSGSIAKITLVDRPAGLSRDTVEPEASFSALERTASSRLEKKDAKGALAAGQSLRALYRALCQEPSPRITPLVGINAWSCNGSVALRHAEVTEARSLAVDGERLRAIFELDVAARFGEKTDPKVLAPNVDLVTVKEKKTYDRIIARPTRGSFSYSPLAFDASGALMARLADGDQNVVWLDGAGPAGAPAPPTWPLSVSSPDGAQRVIEIYDPCDEGAVRVTFAGATSTEDVSLPVEPLLGRKCEGARGGAVSIAPVAWTQSGVALFVLGQYVQITSTFQPSLPIFPADYAAGRGGAGAAHGPFVIVRTPYGIAIDDGKKAHLLRDADKKPVDGSLCVVANDGAHVACLIADKPILYSL